MGTGSGAAGTEYTSVSLTNTGRSTCTLYGYPGVSVIDSAGRTVQRPAARGSTGTASTPAEKTVRVAPGRSGYFLLTSVNVIPSPGCTQAYRGARLRVYPPDNTQSITVAFTRSFCNLGIGPVTASSRF